ncbi:MAG: acetyl-CoA carboxylase biotin carboxyl carrier protein [Candidatus Gastranaerophilaceae bacterium]|jgi:acetyl-CoA carboxylase biotin carboxyl carrier protein
MKFELDYIEKLVKLVSESNLTELTLEDGEKAISLKKEKEFITTSPTMASPISVAAPSLTAPAIQKETAAEVKMGITITSPMVGTFYKASSPGARPFVEVGQKVEKGQVVCIIEAMKLMNEIESEVSGTVLEICVEDGDPVEFGQILMYVG